MKGWTTRQGRYSQCQSVLPLGDSSQHVVTRCRALQVSVLAANSAADARASCAGTAMSSSMQAAEMPESTANGLRLQKQTAAHARPIVGPMTGRPTWQADLSSTRTHCCSGEVAIALGCSMTCPKMPVDSSSHPIPAVPATGWAGTSSRCWAQVCRPMLAIRAAVCLTSLPLLEACQRLICNDLQELQQEHQP